MKARDASDAGIVGEENGEEKEGEEEEEEIVIDPNGKPPYR